MVYCVRDSRSARGALPVPPFCPAVVLLCRQKEEERRKQAIKDKKTAMKQKQEVKPTLPTCIGKYAHCVRVPARPTRLVGRAVVPACFNVLQ